MSTPSSWAPRWALPREGRLVDGMQRFPHGAGLNLRFGAGRLFLVILTAILLLFITFPLVALVLHTPPSSLWASLQTSSAGSALVLSMETTAVTLGLALLFGTPTAY